MRAKSAWPRYRSYVARQTQVTAPSKHSPAFAPPELLDDDITRQGYLRMNVATPLAPQVPQNTMTADEVMRIRMRYNKALRAGMSIPEPTAYANDPDLAGPSVPSGAAES